MQIHNKDRLTSPPKGHSVYIGRGSVFGNPYSIGVDGTREEIIEKYRTYILSRLREDNATEMAFRGLRMNTHLLCHCAPRPCHGEVIEEIWRVAYKDKPVTFVFGSNLAGRHGKGAAKWAHDYFGAIYGKGVGEQNSCYAIPTKSKHLKTLGISEIFKYVHDFITYSRNHPNITFQLTPIGCGLAGYTPKDIAPLFIDLPDNVLIPEEFEDCIPVTTHPTRLLISGSRGISGSVTLADKISRLTQSLDSSKMAVICRTMNGADTIGKQWAEDNEIDITECTPRWQSINSPTATIARSPSGKEYNANAIYDLNAHMVAMATHAILIWDGISTETQHLNKLLEYAKIKKRIIKV